MVIKKILMLLLFLAMFSGSLYAADFYDSYKVNFEYEKSETMKILSYKCMDAGCTTVVPANVEHYMGDSISCWNTYGPIGDLPGYLACMDTYKITGDVLDLNDCSTISNGCSGDPYLFTKFNTENAPFGYVTYYFTDSDDYVPYVYRINSFSCSYGVCVDAYSTNLNFGRIDNAIAEIQQLNVVNLDNPNKPLQIEVPVQIEETVCSAFWFTNPDVFRPLPPMGYSDYSANTKVTLDITNHVTGILYLHDELTIPIEADACAGLAAFSWVPPAGLEDEDIKFRVETDVIDNQVHSSLIDWAEVVETVYPENLDNTCWSRAFDFTLSNKPNFDLTTSIAQITEGERLYAGFLGGAYRDEAIVPMDFRADFYFGSSLEHSVVLSSNTDLKEYFVDLTSSISDVSAGTYQVKLITTPVGASCDIIEDVEQTQNLNIVPVPEYNVDFHVRDADTNLITGANINMFLLEADGDFAVEPTYSNDKTTNSGYVRFDDIIAGNYKYTITKDGYVSATNEIHVATDTEVYVVLNKQNSAPLIDIPDSYTKYYYDAVEIDIKNYVSDFNDDFTDLSFTHQVLSGSANVNFDGRDYTITTSTPNTAQIKITVTDSFGESAFDTTTINFINNEAPKIVDFKAIPDAGDAPFSTNFNIVVNDAEGDVLNCHLFFGNGDSTSGLCSDLDDFGYVYDIPQTYNAKLVVTDGVNSPVEKLEQVFVYQKEFAQPQIIFFDMDSSAGIYVPTNLIFNWKAVHPDGLPMECTLEVNGKATAVPCIGSYNLDNYDKEGFASFVLLADDGNKLDSRQITEDFVRYNHPPVIDSFVVTPKSDYESLTSTFSIDVSDKDGDVLTCTLKYGDGTQDSGECSTLDGITHTYNNVGLYNIELKVTDGEKNAYEYDVVEVFSLPNDAITIEYFDLTTSTGDYLLPNDLTFSWKATHSLSYPMDCTLSINGVPTTVSCVGSYTVNDYNKEGIGTFKISATDGTNLESKTISKTFEDVNTLPVVDKFIANPKTGYDSINTVFEIVASDVDGDELTCTIDFGSGAPKVTKLCTALNGISHVYSVGNYNAELKVYDGEGYVLDYETINVLNSNAGAPVINSFDAIPKSGFDKITSVFDVEVTDPDGNPLTCELNFGDGNVVTKSCNLLDNIDHDYFIGTYTAKLTATDGKYIATKSVVIEVLDSNVAAPVIDNFDANPKFGYDKITSIFDVDVSDADGNELSCTLNFGDGSSVTKECSILNGVEHDYSIGKYTAKLTVTDGEYFDYDTVEIEVVKGNQNAPVINDFDANPKFGYDSLTSTFDVVVSDADGDALTCTLEFGTGSSKTDLCSKLDGITKTYGIGVYYAKLTATDGEYSDIATVKIEVVDSNQNVPVIDNFDANPKFGYDSINSEFDIKVSDADGNSLTCTLKYGDGTQIIDDCNSLNGVVKTYGIGVYYAQLTVTDGEFSAVDSVKIEVIDSNKYPPVINDFDANPKFGYDSLTSTFDVLVSDADGNSLTCTLEFGDGSEKVDDCSKLDGVVKTYSVGVYTAKLTASDGEFSDSKIVKIEVVDSNQNVPVINNFDANPKFGYDKITSTFDIQVSDADGDELYCILEFGDGTQVSEKCVVLDGVSHLYYIGDYTAKLTVSDGEFTAMDTVNIQVIDGNQNAPIINNFDANPKFGYDKINSVFDITVSDADGNDLTCTLDFGDGSKTTKACGLLDGISHVYFIGEYTAKLTVSDGEFTAMDTVNIQVIDGNQNAPVINNFDANPKFGYDSINSIFDVSVSDADGNDLTCVLEFGDGTQTSGVCSSIDNAVHKYYIGTYYAKLTVSDGKYTDVDTVKIEVLDSNVAAPVIGVFDVNPNFGYDEITSTFDIEVSDADGNDLTCTLDFGDLSIDKTGTCDSLDNSVHTYGVGVYFATLTVDDGEFTTTEKVKIEVLDSNVAVPVIDKFDANPKFGYDEITSMFEIAVSDADGNSLSCTLDFGDGSKTEKACDFLDGVSHKYYVGTYTAKLTVTDGEFTAVDSVVIEVEKGNQNAPVIDNFDANPKFGYDELFSTFTVKTSDADGDMLTCTLDFGDGSKTVKACNDLDGIFKLYPIGIYTAKLIVSDGEYTATDSVKIEVLDGNQYAPVIDNFDANPKFGYDEIISVFDVDVSDADGNELTCTLEFGTGSKTVKACDNLDGISQTYGVGVYTAKLTVSDGEFSATDSVKIEVVKGNQNAPVIDNFDANPKFGYDLINSVFDIAVSDGDGDMLTCTLSFGDGSKTIKACGDLDGISKTYGIGKYTATLTASDGEFSATDSIIIEVLDSNIAAPVIDVFDANPKFGYDSINSVFDIFVSDADGNSLSCTLEFGDGSKIIKDCNSLDGVSKTYGVGTYTAKLTATDGEYTAIDTVFIEVVEGNQNAPVINNFDANPKFGYDSINSVFDIEVSDTDGDVLYCVLEFGDGTQASNKCSILDEIEHKYYIGTYYAKLTVDDGKFTSSSTVKIEVLDSNADAPVIDVFDASPKFGYDEIVSTFDIEVSDADGNDLTCTLEFGDSSADKIGPCDSLDNIFHTYGIGIYFAKLTATDGVFTAVDTVKIEVLDSNIAAPIIDDFDANPKFGYDEIISVFDVDVSDVDGNSLSCTLDFGDGSKTTKACDVLNGVSHTYGIGVYTAKLTATDGEFTAVDSVQIEVVDGNQNAPVIQEFDAAPKFGYDKINTLFGILATDADGDALYCTLEFGDGTQASNKCDSLNGITHLYYIGEYTAKLTVSDGKFTITDTVFIDVVDSNANAPVIDVFTANPDYGFDEIDSTFDIEVSDVDDNQVTCTLDFGDGSAKITNLCDNLDNVVHNYQIGVYFPKLTATDGEFSVTATEKIEVLDSNVQAPVIDDFDANPKFGYDEITSVFDVAVSDGDGNSLSCTLDFGDGSKTTKACDVLDGVSHTYGIGVYTAKLTATDGEFTVIDSVQIEVVDGNQFAPVIQEFDAAPKFGYDEINTLFGILATDADGDALYCTLEFGDGTQASNKCDSLNGITHLYYIGEYTAKLTVTDGEFTAVDTVFIEVVDGNQFAPVIDDFDAEPKFGYDEIVSTFEVSVSDGDGSRAELTCTLDFGDGSKTTKACDVLDGVSHTYGIGVYTAKLTATDGEFTVIDSVQIEVVDGNQFAPVIDEFDANPKFGYDMITSVFEIAVSDGDGSRAELTCTLDFGDGMKNTGDCDILNGIAHSYYLGSYVATLTVDDGRFSTSKSVNIEVVDGNQFAPVIDEFDANPKFGYDLITSTFSVSVSDADGSRASLECTLDYGTGGKKVGDCDSLDGLQHSYPIGNYVAKLTVSDGRYTDVKTVAIEVLNSNVYPPEITKFDAEPKFGYDEITSTFTVGVYDKDGNDLSCELDFGDGDKKTTTSCSSLNGLTHKYTIGNYTAKLTVRDSKFNDVETVDIEVADGNVYAPEINVFYGEPDNGVDMLETVFTINVTDLDGDRNELTCTLEFGDGSNIVDACEKLNGVSHIYNIGEFKAKLTVSDGEHVVYGYEDIIVYDSSINRPVVEYIDVGTKTGEFMIPVDVIVKYKAYHTAGWPITCSLNAGGIVYNDVNCSAGEYVIEDYNVFGRANFTITATDGYTSDNKSTEQRFIDDRYKFEDGQVELVIDEVIEPGQFEFGIKLYNETLEKRELWFIPTIVCDGARLEIQNIDGMHESSAISKVYRDEAFVYRFELETLDFSGIIPKDKVCSFEVHVDDKYGTDLFVSEDVMFSYSEDSQTFHSIRGKGTDVLNYMQTAIAGNVERGYNTLTFNARNNEEEDKELKITMLSAELGISFTTELDLAKGEYEEVVVPLYIDEDMPAGNYPVRISVYDGKDKQTRYAYVALN